MTAPRLALDGARTFVHRADVNAAPSEPRPIAVPAAGRPDRLGDTALGARHVIEDIRSGRRAAPNGAARAAAEPRDAAGALLDTRTAGVELVDVLRPTVANARFIAFSALETHADSHQHAALRGGDPGTGRGFALEVRRFFPFIPLHRRARTSPSRSAIARSARVIGCLWTFTGRTAIRASGMTRTVSIRSASGASPPIRPASSRTAPARRRAAIAARARR